MKAKILIALVFILAIIFLWREPIVAVLPEINRVLPPEEAPVIFSEAEIVEARGSEIQVWSHIESGQVVVVDTSRRPPRVLVGCDGEWQYLGGFGGSREVWWDQFSYGKTVEGDNSQAVRNVVRENAWSLIFSYDPTQPMQGSWKRDACPGRGDRLSDWW